MVMFATTLDSSRLYERREMKDLAIKFGERIRQKRIQIGISQDKLALLSEIDRSYVGGLSGVKSTSPWRKRISLQRFSIATFEICCPNLLGTSLGENYGGHDP